MLKWQNRLLAGASSPAAIPSGTVHPSRLPRIVSSFTAERHLRLAERPALHQLPFAAALFSGLNANTAHD